MKIDGLDWMDWLHKVRHEAAEKRIRDGHTVEQWLRQVRARAAESRERRRSREYPAVAHDKPGTESRKPLAVCRQESVSRLLHTANCRLGFGRLPPAWP